MNEEQGKAQIDVLSTILSHEEAIPPGMIARLEAGVLRSQRERRGVPAETSIVVVCLMFLVVGMHTPAAVFGPAAAVVLLLVGVAYVLGTGIAGVDAARESEHGSQKVIRQTS